MSILLNKNMILFTLVLYYIVLVFTFMENINILTYFRLQTFCRNYTSDTSLMSFYVMYMCQFYSTLLARSSSNALLSDKRVRDFECTPLLPTGRKSLVCHSLCKGIHLFSQLDNLIFCIIGSTVSFLTRS